MPLGVLMAALYAPTLADCDHVQESGCQTVPLAQKIFYFHVPAAFGAYAALLVLAVASYMALSGNPAWWDALAVSSAEVGVLFAALTLLSGSLWGHLEWGSDFGYWSNSDVKLVLTLILFLVYAAYLILRRQLDDPDVRARVSAVYALLGFVTVPLSYAAQRVWEQSRHPTVFASPDPSAGLVTPGVEEAFLVNTAAFLALTAFLIAVRVRAELRVREKAEVRHD